jgi:hypothetical protein
LKQGEEYTFWELFHALTKNIPRLEVAFWDKKDQSYHRLLQGSSPIVGDGIFVDLEKKDDGELRLTFGLDPTHMSSAQCTLVRVTISNATDAHGRVLKELEGLEYGIDLRSIPFGQPVKAGPQVPEGPLSITMRVKAHVVKESNEVNIGEQNPTYSNEHVTLTYSTYMDSRRKCPVAEIIAVPMAGSPKATEVMELLGLTLGPGVYKIEGDSSSSTKYLPQPDGSLVVRTRFESATLQDIKGAKLFIPTKYDVIDKTVSWKSKVIENARPFH